MNPFWRLWRAFFLQSISGANFLWNLKRFPFDCFGLKIELFSIFLEQASRPLKWMLLIVLGLWVWLSVSTSVHCWTFSRFLDFGGAIWGCVGFVWKDSWCFCFSSFNFGKSTLRKKQKNPDIFNFLVGNFLKHYPLGNGAVSSDWSRESRVQTCPPWTPTTVYAKAFALGAPGVCG